MTSIIKPMKLAVLVLAMALPACSTVNRGVSDHFRIDTVPQGAKVTTSIIDDVSKTTRNARLKNKDKTIVYETQFIGCEKTPCALKFPRRSEFVAKLEHPGFETAQIFIRSSKLRGGSTASAAANVASGSGSGFAVAGVLAGFEAAITSAFTFGSQSVNASGLAASGAAAGLGIGVGMIAVDFASGANLNLFPNPVVIELAKTGTPTLKDPLVDLYWDSNAAELLVNTACRKRLRKVKSDDGISCKDARADMRQKKAAFDTLKREQIKDLKAALKAARAADNTPK